MEKARLRRAFSSALPQGSPSGISFIDASDVSDEPAPVDSLDVFVRHKDAERFIEEPSLSS